MAFRKAHYRKSPGSNSNKKNVRVKSAICKSPKRGLARKKRK